MSKLNNPVLILNADYTPIEITNWRNAFTLVYSKDKEAYVVATYGETIKDSAGRTYNLPAVVVLANYINAGNKKASYSKTNIKLRDRHTCQYCGRKFNDEKLNVDHVIPRAKQHLLPKGLKVSSWENVVCSCIPCNSKKGDRTLKEAGMHLIKQPRPITKAQKLYLQIKAKKSIPNEWVPYIESLPYE